MCLETYYFNHNGPLFVSFDFIPFNLIKFYYFVFNFISFHSELQKKLKNLPHSVKITSLFNSGRPPPAADGAIDAKIMYVQRAGCNL